MSKRSLSSEAGTAPQSVPITFTPSVPIKKKRSFSSERTVVLLSGEQGLKHLGIRVTVLT
jgi:hypothetical protein